MGEEMKFSADYIIQNDEQHLNPSSGSYSRVIIKTINFLTKKLLLKLFLSAWIRQTTKNPSELRGLRANDTNILFFIIIIAK
jgi:hypothetical protein